MSNLAHERALGGDSPADEIKQLQAEVDILKQRLQVCESRTHLLNSLPQLIWSADLNGSLTYINNKWREYTGRSETEALGFGFFQSVHPEDREALLAQMQQVVTQPTNRTLEFRLRQADRTYQKIVAGIAPIRGENNQILAYTGFEVRQNSTSTTLTSSPQHETGSQETPHWSEANEPAPLSENALYFLAQASVLLGASLDSQTTLENLAKLIVPYFADWCAINVAECEGHYRCVAVAHADLSKESLVWELQRRYPVSNNGTYSYLQPLRTNNIDACFEISNPQLLTIAYDREHLDLLQALSLKSYICLPIRLGRRTFGSILFVRATRGHLYSNSTLPLAEDLARRAALALDNALLYQQAQRTGENLRYALRILDEQQQQLRTLQQLAELLNQRIADLPSLLQVMVDAVAGAIPGAQFCMIALHDETRNRLKLTAIRGTENLPFGRALYIEDGLLARVFTTGQSILLQRESLEPAEQGEIPAALYAVAIESPQAGRLGVLAVGNWDRAGAFDRDAQNLLTAVGKQAAIAINNARLIDTLEKREELLEFQNNLLVHQNLELESQRQRIERQNLQLLEAARLKSQFLTTVSHELRTPMNAIIGFSQLLLRQRQYPLTIPQRDMVQRIFNNGKNLLMLIDDIRDLSKIERGKTELEIEEFDLTLLVITTALEFGSLANQKNLGMSVCIYLQNRFIVNDRLRLRQILVNLLSNAIKFTEQGGVYLHVWELAFDRVVITIRDTGIGIVESDLPHIFEKFRQLDQTTKRKYPGTGLGLAITDSLIKIMNGKISVESQVGKGSIFRLELPRQIATS